MLRQLLTKLNININSPQDLDKIPPAPNSFEIMPGVNLPLYGELLVGERLILKQISQATTPYLVNLNKLLESLNYPNLEFDELYSQLQLGMVICPVYKDYTPDYDNIGYQQLKDLATAAKVEFFTSYTPIVDGQLTEALKETIKEYRDYWYNNSIPGETDLDKANNVLKKTIVKQFDKVEVKQVNSQVLLDSCHLTWEDLQMFKGVNDATFQAQLLIYFRLGFIDFNILEYVVESQAEKVSSAVAKEISGSSNTVEEVIIPNQNLDKQESNNGGEEVLKPE